MIHDMSQSATPADTQRDRLALGVRVPAPCASCSGALTARLPHRVTRRAAGTVELTCERCGAADTVPAALAGRLMAGE
ncbi:hypothetical protein Psed_7017 (plasmid) [Pseudonocardia dioxanivorans CB1190]|uniref:Uncharacterized protein n=1 Tax=Pseudonocardia dioxanivorans (strain ATCC 55486 / DSM 44775 / JCM 13855 / CB1190) TaxID=675635 RepID=F2L7A1_PSEUX|nr:hypothetical protein Psed_7017 [Pseudonocardia dioxanivorans CB1190]